MSRDKCLISGLTQINTHLMPGGCQEVIASRIQRSRPRTKRALKENLFHAEGAENGIELLSLRV